MLSLCLRVWNEKGAIARNAFYVESGLKMGVEKKISTNVTLDLLGLMLTDYNNRKF
ncbi:hypothetical protein [Candidatus Methylospira mobilis]|uniref:hypothetical protein n=1 Tax=Candidatus Methylospira mobilis TaxID=1808979 RepID=UPI0012940CFE|nr:hypothetical protein [Candidatus Methylospira mobilis]